MLSAGELAEKVRSYHPSGDVEMVRRAYAYSELAHEGQKRKSGDPYFIHPVSVASIIADMRLDVASVCAALLHDVVEDTDVTDADIEREFGADVAFLVDGVTKLSKINFISKQDRTAESFRKLIVAMSRDLRVLVVKLCDRLDNMRTLDHMSDEGKERIARETMDIYAPLANRLGLASFRNELQDLSFKHLYPDVFADLERSAVSTAGERDAGILRVRQALTQKLGQQGFACRVEGRSKHLYSVWRKMHERQCTYDQVHDLTAVQVVMESVADCYAALGVIHSLWTPVPGRFKDYIALPKPNMYQSLHTTVFGPSHQRIEVQIRTTEMHGVAERGVAAHWRLGAGASGGLDPRAAAQFTWLRQLVESQDQLKDPTEFLESVKIDLFQDEVYVFTPKGDVRAFPRGSTPIDFAYSIHTDLGDRCTGARINGGIAQLSYKLRNGDLVEVLTSPDQRPHKEWLEWALTAKARGRIRGYLRTTQREKSMKLGHDLLEKALHEADISLGKLEHSSEDARRLCDALGYEQLDDVYVHVGYGKLKTSDVVDALAPLAPESSRRSLPPASLREGRIEAFVRKVTGRNSHGVLLNGVDDVLVRYTKCCNPLPGDEIIGFMTRGRGVTVHRKTCERAFETDPERRVAVSWDPKAKINRMVQLKVTTANRPGILATVGQTFHGAGINISEAACRAGEDGRAENLFTFLCADLAQLKGVMKRLAKVEGVVDVSRT
ncbi:MAG: bifunctional (p)ppGpp synthetase/guanosine-3',5'-bis(diphosphate) 3'-pyrophosphohydrolase [Deltaproteobacteria bacterium]|nr:bifunctional (p)ppGpp synthetase/guanosine-3',5'-bis(diphosphate) 3'-pyrophosphohydrolase [Deltaproteobacteria bacterium]